MHYNVDFPNSNFRQKLPTCVKKMRKKLYQQFIIIKRETYYRGDSHRDMQVSRHEMGDICQHSFVRIMNNQDLEQYCFLLHLCKFHVIFNDSFI